MLRDYNSQETVTTFAFLVAVEVSDQYGPTQEAICLKLADGPWVCGGVWTCRCRCIG